MLPPDILERSETLTREHPGAVLTLRTWYQADQQEHHCICAMASADDQWSGVGKTAAEAYVDMRRRMVMGE